MMESLHDLNSLPEWVYIAPLILLGLLVFCWIAFFFLYVAESPAVSTMVGVLIGLHGLVCVGGLAFFIVAII